MRFKTNRKMQKEAKTAAKEANPGKVATDTIHYSNPLGQDDVENDANRGT